MIHKRYQVQNETGETMAIDLRFSEGTRDAATIIILHGFKGFKDWGFFPDLGSRLTASGYATVTFNFSRNGIGLNPDTFSELDKFADNTYSQEISDVKSIVNAIQNGSVGKNAVDPEQLGILGHSRGGAVAILSALELEDRFKAIVTWATISNLYRYSDEQIEQWKKQGYIEMENSRTKQMMRMNKTFWEDLNKNKKEFDLITRIEDLEIPSLFLHGREDTSVPCTESEELHENCGAYQKRLELIEETGHTFGMRHPMEDTVTSEYELAASLSEDWFDRYLSFA